ncbi:dockerin type I domain-containing protein [Lewinella sp. JB7]|uniref:dockerin type I domain-containing protein n=1 Tax=Lewinella sp. JB7 TaxID=2962887 RepID=UPI0020C98B43|nr:dockerin type I domain-containing protein [Lewinella sp. JB7]MCP9236536.1 dockerin type I domain-containing protein [Lewinella sp. JB7]
MLLIYLLAGGLRLLRYLLMPCLLIGWSATIAAQSPPVVIDFEGLQGTLTDGPELDPFGISFGTPSVSLQDLPPLNLSPPRGVTVFTRRDAPSGQQVAANCSGGISCEFPSNAVLMEFAEPTASLSFRIQGFNPTDQFLIYGYDEAGAVSLLRSVPATTDYQTVRVPGAKGYIIDLSGSSSFRAFFLDDISYTPARGGDQVEMNCGTGDELLERLETDAVFRQNYDRIERLTQEYIRTLREGGGLGFGGEVITIPVVVHVVYKNATENITDAQIQSQIDALNELFRATNPGIAAVPSAFSPQVADMQLQFALASRDPECEPTNGITRTSTTTPFFTTSSTSTDPLVRNPVKFAATGGRAGWPADEYLNIWVCDVASGLLGYSSWPADLASRPAEDGVVMDYTAFGTVGTAGSPFDQGYVCGHEIGHWLNLRHIWGDDQLEPDNCAFSDLVDDTPNQGVNNTGCPAFPSVSCDNGPDGDMFMNQMDYTDDACRTMFTVGQHVRAAATLFGVRASIIGSDALAPPPASPADPDLWSADTHDDVGNEPNASGEAMYHSADIWVRRTNDGFLNQEHQNPVYRSSGEPNYVYVRVRNRGCGDSQTGTTNLYWAKAGSGLSWPTPWDGSIVAPALMGDPIGSQSVTVAGGEFEILEFAWTVPNPDDYAAIPGDEAHFCLLSRIDEPGGMTFPETANLYQNVQNNNNIVWKNISIGSEDADGGGFASQVIVGNFSPGFQRVNLRFDLPGREVRSLFDHGRVIVELGDLYEIWRDNDARGTNVLIPEPGIVELLGPESSIDLLPLESGELFGVRVRFVPDANPVNAVYALNMTQEDAETGAPIGGNQFRFRTAARGVRLPGDGGGSGGDNSPPVLLDCPQTVAQFCEFPLTVSVDMSNVPVPDQFLGNFTAALYYDPTEIEYVGDAEILSGYTGRINTTTPGVIVFNGADATGHEDLVPIFTARFRALAPAGVTVDPDLTLRTLAAATTFRDLLPTATVHNCTFTISENQLLGDVNGDGRINSTDAALILAYSVGNPIPAGARARIASGIADVDTSGTVTAADALLIISYDVGLPVAYPLGTATVCTDADRVSEGKPVETGPTVPVEVAPERDGIGYSLPLRIDMRGSGERLGSYQLEVTWDPARWQFDGLQDGSTPGFARPTVNLRETASGRLRLAHAYAPGSDGLVHLGNIRLLPRDADMEGAPEPGVVLSDLTAAGTFHALQPVLVRQTTAVGNPDGIDGVTFTTFPNPFRGATTLTVELTRTGPLTLSILDARGREVAELGAGDYPAGAHRFHWRADGPSSLPAGVYVARIRVGTRVMTRRLVLLR